MPYAGHTLRPREACIYIAQKWQNVDERHKALATMLAESRCNIGAWHDNVGEGGAVISRDCGLYQINVPVERLNTVELLLRSESEDFAEWEPAAKHNVGIARQMWEYRKWQPWVAYNTGWATFPEWWVWRQEEEKPVGPWVPTGRYIHKAIVGWANWHLLIAKTKNENGALASAYNQQVKWKVKGELALSAGKVAWKSHPPKPEEPPADGVGPRPKPNDGT